MSIALSVILGIALLLGVGLVGFQVPPGSFPPHPEKTHNLGTVELPSNLPEPVYRHFVATVGSQVPKIESAVVWGRGKLKIKGLWLPVRFKAYYVPGQDFYRSMEVTWFGRPILQGVDSYIDGEGVLNIAGNTVTGDKIAQGQNLALWGEAIWMPSIYFTDPRVRWEATDDMTARLIVPFGEQEESFLVEFDPQTGLIREMSAKRYRGEEKTKTLWRVECLDWKPFHGIKIPTRVIATWADEKNPYVVLTVEGVEYNVDVSQYIKARNSRH